MTSLFNEAHTLITELRQTIDQRDATIASLEADRDELVDALSGLLAGELRAVDAAKVLEQYAPNEPQS